MKPSKLELSILKAIVKALGVYQIILAATDIFGVFLLRLNLKQITARNMVPGKEGELYAWCLFHLGLAMMILLWTDAAGRRAMGGTTPPKGGNGAPQG